MAMEPAERAMDVLRAYRHELANAVQTISGWLQLGCADRALEQSLQLAARLQEHGDFLRLKAPAVALTLLAESMRALQQGVPLRLEISSELDGLDPLEQARLAEAVAQLVRDACERATGHLQPPHLSLTVAEDADGYRFEVGKDPPLATLRWPHHPG